MVCDDVDAIKYTIQSTTIGILYILEEEGRGKREEGRRKREEGRRKMEEGRRRDSYAHNETYKLVSISTFKPL